MAAPLAREVAWIRAKPTQEGETSANCETHLTKASRVRHWLEIRGPRTDAARALSASAAGVKTSSLGRMRASTFRPGRACRVCLAAGSNVGMTTPSARRRAPGSHFFGERGSGRRKCSVSAKARLGADAASCARFFARGFTARAGSDFAPRERPEPDQLRPADLPRDRRSCARVRPCASTGSARRCGCCTGA